MIAREGEARRRHLRICALSIGLGDKASASFRARAAQGKAARIWVERCKSQISGVLEVLEKERSAVKTPYWFGEKDRPRRIAVACVLRLTGEAHPALLVPRAIRRWRRMPCVRSAVAVQGNRAAAGATEGVKGRSDTQA